VGTPILAAVALVALAACSAGGGAASTRPSGASPAASVSPAASLDVAADVVDPVVADAAARAGVAPDQATVVSAEAMTWSDGSLGCPEPGMLYTQAIVDGYQVVVEAGGNRYDYRVTGPGAFRLCEQPG
jgi:hypothetical protein